MIEAEVAAEWRHRVRLVSTICHRTPLRFPLSVTGLFVGPSLLLSITLPKFQGSCSNTTSFSGSLYNLYLEGMTVWVAWVWVSCGRAVCGAVVGSLEPAYTRCQACLYPFFSTRSFPYLSGGKSNISTPKGHVRTG